MSEEPSRKNIFKASRGDPGFAELTGPKGTNGLLNSKMVENLSAQKEQKTTSKEEEANERLEK